MRVAVVNEVSARDKNSSIVKALKTQGLEVFNIGMTDTDEQSSTLTYIHTGLMAAIALNVGAVDLVVGGCGTGQGFLNSAMQYPLVFCGLIESPLDAWLFAQINGGNCISLALNKGYGWAGDINLEHVFEKLFSQQFGGGYPKERSKSQKESRALLQDISVLAHKPFAEILSQLNTDIAKTVFSHAPFVELLKGECKNKELQAFIVNKFLGE